MLIGSGAGAAICEFLSNQHRVAAVMAAALVSLLLLAGFVFLLPGIVYKTLSWDMAYRTAMTFVWVFPLGMIMGVPFPAGLAEIGKQRRAAVPWAFGVNAAASVVGSIIAIMLAMEKGFSAVLCLAALIYLGAAATFRKIG